MDLAADDRRGLIVANNTSMCVEQEKGEDFEEVDAKPKAEETEVPISPKDAALKELEEVLNTPPPIPNTDAELNDWGAGFLSKFSACRFVLLNRCIFRGLDSRYMLYARCIDFYTLSLGVTLRL